MLERPRVGDGIQLAEDYSRGVFARQGILCSKRKSQPEGAWRLRLTRRDLGEPFENLGNQYDNYKTPEG